MTLHRVTYRAEADRFVAVIEPLLKWGKCKEYRAFVSRHISPILFTINLYLSLSYRATIPY